jgi:diguanylate cyclase (GGDEF)-like protein
VGAADELTGLPSARAFADAVERQAALARRYDRPGAVILLAGARADDPGCRAVARALRERLRATDLITRTSGCEFAILLPEARKTEAREVAGELVDLAARVAGLPAAAGVGCFPDGLDRPAGALLADADTALAAAHGAVPPVVVFEARVSRAPGAADSPAERLRRLLDGDGLVLERPPVIDVHSGAVDHHAVVAGLRDAPEELLERAERFGLGREVDRRAVEHALAAGSDERSLLVVPLAVGAAADRRFADWLVDALSADAATAVRIVLAVPESAALLDLAAVRSLAARAGEYGARLALDRFGRLGAFALLKALPVHQVRLDAGLVRGLPASDRDRAIVLALVHAAEALGAEPVATGVDCDAELTAVRGFGINLAQGAVPAMRDEI